MMFYKIDFGYKDKLQSELDRLYNYGSNIATKISHRNRINLFYLLMKKLIDNGTIYSFDSAIDIGCNAGIYSKIISDFGFKHVIGVDIKQDFIDKANGFSFSDKDRILEYKVVNAEDMDTTKKYDFILCTEVIEHADNPNKIIDNIKSVLAPDGIAVISLPNRISIPYFLTLLHYKLSGNPMNKSLEQHLGYPFYKSIRIFKDKNMKVVDTTGTNLIFFGALLRFLYDMPGFPLINKINFYLSGVWPLKYFTQFFFIVVRR